MTRAAEIRARLLEPWQHGEHADFHGLVCEEMLDLAGVPLAGVDFTGAQFKGGIDARGARFDGLAWFQDVQFNGPAHFDGAVFMNDARFEGVHFADASGFKGVEFRGIGRFDRAQFERGVDFSETVCFGNFSLQSATGRAPFDFRHSEWLGGLWCDQVTLPERADFSDTQVHGRLWLRGARRGNAPLTTKDFGMSFGYSYI